MKNNNELEKDIETYICTNTENITLTVPPSSTGNVWAISHMGSNLTSVTVQGAFLDFTSITILRGETLVIQETGGILIIK